MQKADHSGHRSRMKKKLMERGLESFEQHEILEILLYYAIPQRNTNDIAKNLINEFGSLSGVLDASMQALTAHGLTQHQALYLKLFPDVARLYISGKHSEDKDILSGSRLTEYIKERFIGRVNEEYVLLVLINSKGKAVFGEIISKGDISSATLSIRDIITKALDYSASSVVIAHNHPSGFSLPSRDDVMLTRELKSALKHIKVDLLDHYIVCDDECVSLAECGLI